MKKYLLERENLLGKLNGFNAGSKAREDINFILESNSFEKVMINLGANKLQKIKSLLTIKGKIAQIKDDSIVVIQYPVERHILTKKILNELKRKKCKIICIIHDMDSLRYKNQIAKKEECEVFNMSDVIICHNDIMKNKIAEYGIKTKVISLKLFDYIVEENKEKEEKNNMKKNENIVFAGNLAREKSGFIYKLKDVGVSLYGANIEEENLNENIKYLGKFEPNKIPDFDGAYGLIWDGELIEECNGDTGEYLKFNNPHKLSLYMAAGIPVIAWKKAAIANFINVNKIGFTVESLKEVNLKMAENKKYYEEYIEKCKIIKNRVRMGLYLTESIEKAVEYIEVTNR